ncbi:MAG: hypothetical protein PHX00_11985, partial [Synergistaceae bacterium]|nr:hypothetical protein [Synergistaceae bacterium]
ISRCRRPTPPPKKNGSEGRNGVKTRNKEAEVKEEDGREKTPGKQRVRKRFPLLPPIPVSLICTPDWRVA